MSESSREKIHCNVCTGPRWHSKKAGFEAKGVEEIAEGYEEPWHDRYEIFQCLGCDSTLVRRSFWFGYSGVPDEEVSYFPPRVSRHDPIWSYQLPNELRELLREVYNALQSDSRRLALMGIRAIVDMAMVEQVGDVGNFPTKLEAFEEKGIVGSRQRRFLAAVLDAGNAAAHRGHAPSEEQLSDAMDIVENLLQATFVLEEAAEKLRQSTPGRSSDSGSIDGDN